MRLLSSFLCVAALPSLLFALNAPFHASSSWIIDSTGANFTYAGVNWPGAGEVMIPEGLQYQSIASIVSKIKSINMNVVRLTFAIEMIDDIKDNGGDVSIQKAFTKALGSTNGEKVFQQVIKNNPQFSTSTTRLQVGSELVGAKSAAYRCLRRFSMLSRPSSGSKASTSIWTTTCPKARGAARPTTGMHGSGILTSTLISGSAACSSWPTT